jgi:hypothetical protein
MPALPSRLPLIGAASLLILAACGTSAPPRRTAAPPPPSATRVTEPAPVPSELTDDYLAAERARRAPAPLGPDAMPGFDPAQRLGTDVMPPTLPSERLRPQR